MVCCCGGRSVPELLPEMLLYCLEDLESSQSQPKSEIASDERDHSGGLRLDNLLLVYLYPAGGLYYIYIYQAQSELTCYATAVCDISHLFLELSYT